MNDLKLKEFDAIKADRKLIDSTTQQVQGMLRKRGRKRPGRMAGMIAVASMVVVAGSYAVYTNINSPGQSIVSPVGGGETVVAGGVKVPAIELPSQSNGAADMIGLIVYDGRIYTQSLIENDPDKILSLLGEKLGRTKGTLNEWSEQDAYATEFASSIGEADVYTVKGYDTDFRIMTYIEQEDGTKVAQLFECLNGMTVSSGADLFGKLNLGGNIVQADYRSFSDWDYEKDNFQPFQDNALLDQFTLALLDAVPYLTADNEERLGDYRNDARFKELVLQLDDGLKVSLKLVEGGYVLYNGSPLFFALDGDVFRQVWSAMGMADGGQNQ
ncbi:hypothetical protein EBB07_01975 [Paenibacillaceae bacterium]|nr:hypothetical protein EBB07_01975 [Paenibacillaceae bacterium]